MGDHCGCWRDLEKPCCDCLYDGDEVVACRLILATRQCPLPLTELEVRVEQACRAIYREFEGYWPSDSERARIAVALLAAAGSGAGT